MNESQRFVLIAVAFIFLVSAFRVYAVELGGYWPNFTPIGAIALFSGVVFSNRWIAFGLPIGVLFFSDIAIQALYYPEHLQGLLYKGWYWNYGVFLLIVLLGYRLRSQSFGSIVLKSVLASVLHYVITNFVVWASGGLDVTTGLLYTQDLSGLLKSYVLALPFLRNFVLGTLFYCALLFGGFRIAVSKLGYKLI